jgi:hypothetical protein
MDWGCGASAAASSAKNARSRADDTVSKRAGRHIRPPGMLDAVPMVANDPRPAAPNSHVTGGCCNHEREP